MRTFPFVRTTFFEEGASLAEGGAFFEGFFGGSGSFLAGAFLTGFAIEAFFLVGELFFFKTPFFLETGFFAFFLSLEKNPIILPWETTPKKTDPRLLRKKIFVNLELEDD